jgi:hypothetical protein
MRFRIRNPFFVIIYAVIAFLILHFEWRTFEDQVVMVALLSESFKSPSRRSPAVIFPGINFTNLSLGLNYDEGFFCTEQHGYMSFTPNREWHQGQYSVLCILTIFYPPEQLSTRFRMVCNILHRLSSAFTLSPGPVAFLILSIDVNVLPLVHAHSAFTEISCLSSSDVCSSFLNLDDGYHVFQTRFDSYVDDVGGNLTVFVTNVRQSEWNRTWLRQRHVTGGVENGVPFLGYYSAAFAYLVTLPYRLKLLDYFDFFSRLDLDAPFQRDTPTSQGDFFPVRNMIERRAFLFGCFVRLDNPRVSVNIMNMTRLFLNRLKRQCTKPLRSHSRVIGFLYDERQCIPGIFQQFWLGFFSCPELKRFTNTWFAYPEGHRIYRWGDQQYYFRAYALFTINASRRIITNNDAAGCSYYRGHRLHERMNLSILSTNHIPTEGLATSQNS